MSEAITFKAHTSVDTSSVEEEGSRRYCAGFMGQEKRKNAAGEWAMTSHGERAKAYAAALNIEHANGRKPQAFCGPFTGPAKNRVPCDFERIGYAPALTEAQRASLVLCDVHAGAALK